MKNGGDFVYLNYEKLWKLLLSKRLTKNDLCSMSGISTRTLAKLVKNQSVTTDTLLHICDALDCGIDDILEITKEKLQISLYDSYKQERRLIGEDEFCLLYELFHNGTRFLIKEIKKKATKRNVIHCRDNCVVWEKLYPAGHAVLSVPTVITDFHFVEKGSVCILLVDGSAVGITGLDEGRFLSEKRPYEDQKLYVMSKARFKLFQFNK